MNVNIVGNNGHFVVTDSVTGKIIDVKHITMYLNQDGLCEVGLYVGLGKLDVAQVPRMSDGVRETRPAE
jgi:hypothetical protein